MSDHGEVKARWANQERTAFVIDTGVPFAPVAGETKDGDPYWALLQTEGVSKIAKYVPPPEEAVDPVKKLADFLAANPDVAALMK